MDSRQALLKKSWTENNSDKKSNKKTVKQLVLNRFQSTHRCTQKVFPNPVKCAINNLDFVSVSPYCYQLQLVGLAIIHFCQL